MLDCLKFVFNCVLEFISMLFTIDLGFTNLGALMCIVYIFLPVILIIINFIKKQMIDEFDDSYDIKHRSYKVYSDYTGKHEKKAYKGKHEKG